MSSINLPWKYSHIKCLIGYRKWERLRHIQDAKYREKLVEEHEEGKIILFIHIPKTAGVSLINTYDDYFIGARHTTALSYKSLLGSKYDDFISLAIVRNPWTRLFSAYNFLMEGGLIDIDKAMGEVLKRQCPTFEHFVKEWLPRHGACSYMHFVPQHEFTCGWGKSLIVNNIIKLERLNEEWPRIANKLQLPMRKIKHTNKSIAKDYRHYYDNESADIVGRLYKDDIQLFKYCFDESV